MATFYVRSGAAGAGTGADWANAFTTLAAALSGSSGNDVFYLAADHAESSGSTITLTFAGVDTNPNKVICVDHTGSVPPVSADLRTTATISTTGAATITLGNSAVFYGVTLTAGSNSSNINFTVGSVRFMRFVNCALNLGSSGSGSRIVLQGGAQIELHNTTLGFNNIGQAINFTAGNLRWTGTSSTITGTVPTNLISPTANRVAVIDFDGIDLSPLTSGKNIASTSATSIIGQIKNCRLGSSVGVGLPTAVGGAIDILNSDSGSTNYRNERYAWAGTLTTETTIAMTGGASDGTTGFSHKIVTTTNARDVAPFESFPMMVWCDSTGSSKTVTLEMVNDGVTFTNAEVWAEARYLGNSSYPLASVVTNAPADLLASGSSLSTSSATWTTTGLSSPVKQYIQLTFTPQKKGWVRVVLKVARASTTLYLDPKPVLA